MILDTLAEAFQGEHDVRGSHTVYVSQAKEALVKSEEQEGDTDVETALAVLAQESDTDLEETDVQEILLACKESRQLRGEQRVNCGFRPVTGRTSEGKPCQVGSRLNIGELTLYNTMHDEQPFCQNLTERRRTTVRFLGQQSEMTIGDTWPQTGEMRSLWKGTTEFWTNDMPQDDTWEANRHHSHILPLFRSDLSRDAAAMFPLRQNPVASTEHECRDRHLPAVPHTEHAEDKGRRMVLGLPKLYSVYSTHHDDSSGATESQRQDPGEGMSSPVGQTPGKWYGKGNTCQLCGTIINDKGEITEPASPYSGKWCPTRRSAIPARRWRDAQNWIWCKTRSTKPRGCWKSPGQSDRRNCRRRTWSQPVNEDRSEETFAGIDFCEATTSEVHAVLRQAPADLRGGTLLQHPRVLVATMAYQENPHLSACRSSMQPGSKSFEVHTYCCG